MKTKRQAMLQALEKNLGIVSAACKAVGISRQTHYMWLKEDEEYRSQVEAIPDVVLDFAENKLYKAIQDGNITATIFFLKTKGKDRGYIERIQQEDITAKPKQLVIVRETSKSED